MIFLDYLFALVLFVLIYLAERLILFWFKKKAIWPLVSYDLLIDLMVYTIVSLAYISVLHLIFKKTQTINLLWLDASLYLLIKLIKPHHIFFVFKNKEKVQPLQKHYLLGFSLFVVLLLECFVFNSKAYSHHKATQSFDTFVCESISSNGEVSKDKIVLKTKQYIIINTNQTSYDNLYLHFNNDDMNLYVNMHVKKIGEEDYSWYKYCLIDPAINSYGYISLENMNDVESLKIVFDIDESRYLNASTTPTLVLDKIAFDAYFPLIVNPLRIALIFGAITIVVNFRKLFISNTVKEDTPFRKIEKVILFGGAIAFTYFVIMALINNGAYFIKYDQLYLGGTSSNNIYYQQLDAYIKGQLYIDAEVDPKLLTISNPYDPAMRNGMTVLWDHAFYNGKYYCYYGHAPIFLVMLPIYWISGYVPTNLFVLQLGVLFSVFAFLLAALQIIKLLIKKANTVFVILVLISALFGSLLFTNNTYEYGGMPYRIPYAYANGFLFLTIYLLLKGYDAEKKKWLYLSFMGLSLVFIVLSRPLELMYLLVFVPIIIKMIKSDIKDKKGLLINYAPMVSIVLIGAIIICVMNYARFGSILEFGEHYQLTVTDCTKNHLDYNGLLPTIYHYFVKPPKLDKQNNLLIYNGGYEGFDTHPYITSSVGLLFVPIFLFFFIIPYIFKKDDEFFFKYFVAVSPVLIFIAAFINYCFAGVCPRYLLDFAPWAAISGGIFALKAIEKDDGKHPIVPSLISIVLIVNILISGQYHFIGFDGLRIGDFEGFLGIIKTIRNEYNV